MARKARQRICYVLPLAKQINGHRLGVNGLAVDPANSILYSGGRDGVICAWDLHLDLARATAAEHDAKPEGAAAAASTCRQQVQAHTHWINDIALAHDGQALVSASSDLTVKVWRPTAAAAAPPQTIGLHSDYVKTLTVPSPGSDWVASGGLDRKICLWDLSGAGQRLCIDVNGDEQSSSGSREKGSVYALAAANNTIASGGPESTVRVWDARSGQRITRLVGHTDNVRDILVSQDGATIMTASSDQTVKVWSTSAGRCVFTLTMHDASVWSLFSSDPNLSVFYSSDRSGLIAKTDTRNTVELDEGISVALAQEHEGVHKIIQAGESVWTATSRPSINRWRDVNTDDAEIEVPENYSIRPPSMHAAKLRHPSPPSRENGTLSLQQTSSASRARRLIPLKHMLRLSNTAFFPTPLLIDGEKRLSVLDRRGSKDVPLSGPIAMQPVRSQPEFAIEGQNGLIKHVMLNDRKHVLTTDTAGEVVMWDLHKCVPVRSFGKRHLEDVREEVTTNVTVANWCTVDTRTGSVAVVLEEHTCFDAELYADELELDADLEFRDDQRVNLGKWILRYLFSDLINEEIKRDDAYRKQLLSTFEETKRLQRDNAPTSIQLPSNGTNTWQAERADSALTPKASGRTTTPGLVIGMATPGVVNAAASPARSTPGQNPFPTGGSESAVQSSDYFSSSSAATDGLVTPSGTARPAVTPGESQEDPTTPSGDGTPTQASAGGKFGKKFSMRGMTFSGMKKMGRNPAKEDEKPAIVEEKEEVESDARSSHSNNRVVDENLLGTVQKLRFGYEDELQQQLHGQQAHANGLPVAAVNGVHLLSSITPSLPAETPVLKVPANTVVLIQEDRPEAGGVVDLFEGTVGSMAAACDLVEKTAPMWLGEVLLRNQVPFKEIVKISFILEPLADSGLPTIVGEGNGRLNANRMLRAKKVLSYVAERLEPPPEEGEERPRPEEYLELWCQNRMVPPNMTLATIRSHVWRGGGDVYLYYKANGTRELKPKPPPAPVASNIPLSPRPMAPSETAAGAA